MTTHIRVPGWWAAQARNKGTTLARQIIAAQESGKLAAALDSCAPPDGLLEGLSGGATADDLEPVRLELDLEAIGPGPYASPTARVRAAIGKALGYSVRRPKSGVRRVALLAHDRHPIRYAWVPEAWTEADYRRELPRSRQLAVCAMVDAPTIPYEPTGAEKLSAPWYSRPAKVRG